MGGKREPLTLCHVARPSGYRQPNQTCVADGGVCKCFIVPAKPRYSGSAKGRGSFGDEGKVKYQGRTSKDRLETTKGKDPGQDILPSHNLWQEVIS